MRLVEYMHVSFCAVSVAVDFRNVSSLSCQRALAYVNALGYRCSAECKRVCM